MDQQFDEFCRQHQIEPTDRDRVFWLAGLQATAQQLPVAYGHFTPSGELIQLTQFIDPARQPVPLYRAPTPLVRHDIPQDTIEHVWRVHYAQDNDIVGFARWVEKTVKKP